VLVDQHVVPSDRIQATAQDVDGVMTAYDIRSRGSRERSFAELTIGVDRTASVEAAHRIADRVEERLRGNLHFHEVIVHVEPY
jgi:ferrous-iron efflux pump FieF